MFHETGIFSIDLTDVSESAAAVTMFSRVLGVRSSATESSSQENILWNGTDSSGNEEEHIMRPKTCCDQTAEVGRSHHAADERQHSYLVFDLLSYCSSSVE